MFKLLILRLINSIPQIYKYSISNHMDIMIQDGIAMKILII
jgi:hypothetical protein